MLVIFWQKLLSEIIHTFKAMRFVSLSASDGDESPKKLPSLAAKEMYFSLVRIEMC